MKSKIHAKLLLKKSDICVYELIRLVTVFLFSLPILNFGQTPDLKTCADFILFTSSGGITNTGVSQILGGAVGTDFGALTGFDDVNCVKHIANDETAQCKLDLQDVYDEISAITPTATITAASLTGTITPGVYQINTAVDITSNLTLDADGNPDALFIFKVTGAISVAASIDILLTNGASVNNIFWHGTAAIGAGAGASLKGTYMTNAGAIALGAGAVLEGRALTVIGEVTMSGSTLTGCIMPEATTVTLTQPTYDVATGTIQVTAPLGAGITYSIDGIDFTNTTGLFENVPGGEYTVTSKNSDGCISWTDVTLVGYVHIPDLKTCADFILFTSSGGITNTGVSQILGGAIGTNFGALTGFDDVNCVKHIADDETAQCKADLQAVYDEITAITPTATITAASLTGIITPGIYEINEAVALTIDLTLDAQNNPDALFIFKVTGAISTAASVNINLINGASVNNIFWHGTAAIGAGADASLKGTFMTNAGAISLGAGAVLEGRALTVIGEVTIDSSTLTGCIMPEATTVTLTQPDCSTATGTIEVTAPLGAGMTYSIDGTDFSNTTGLFTKVPAGDYTVTSKNTEGCISTIDITLTGFPHPPELGTVTDFVLFTSVGDVTNTGVSTITGGAIGTHAGAITGYDSGVEQHIADAATLQCKADLQAAFDEIDAMPTTEAIVAAYLSGATLTAGVYQINTAATLAANLTLDAQGNSEAMFIFKVTGAFSVAASVHINLINGASVNNVFWNVDGAIDAGAGATMRGTFLALAGAISLGDGANLEGRALTIAGAVTTNNSAISVCIRPEDPVIILTQPNCSLNTGSITITSPTGAGMTYRIDYCDFTNTTGIFTEVPPGTYLVTAKDVDGCISDGTTVIINEESPDITWTGAAGSEWNNIDNWDLAEIPGAYCDAIIPINSVVNIGSGTPAESKGLTVESGATVTIQSDASNNGSLIVNGTSSGNVTYNRYVTANNWHLLASPVSGQSISEFQSANSIAFQDPKYGIAPYDNANPGWDHYTTSNIGSAGNFTPGKGYEVQSTATELSFTGSINTSDVSIALTTPAPPGKKWNLIGNPFTASVNANNKAGGANNFIDINAEILDEFFVAIYVWDALADDYATINNSGTAFYVAPCQAFFVYAATEGNASFNETMQTSQTGDIFKSSPTGHPAITLFAENEGHKKSTHIKYIDEMTTGLDPGYDAGRFSAGDNSFFICTQLAGDHTNQTDLDIQCLPPGEYHHIIPVGLNASAGIEIVFSAQISNLPVNVPVILEDRQKGVYTPLHKNGSSYRIVTETQQEGTGRFYLHTQQITTGMNNQDEMSEVFVLPRPQYNKLRITGDLKKGATFSVYDIAGRKLGTGKLNPSQINEVDMHNLKSGIYFVEIGSAGKKFIRKISWIKTR